MQVLLIRAQPWAEVKAPESCSRQVCKGALIKPWSEMRPFGWTFSKQASLIQIRPFHPKHQPNTPQRGTDASTPMQECLRVNCRGSCRVPTSTQQCGSASLHIIALHDKAIPTRPQGKLWPVNRFSSMREYSQILLLLPSMSSSSIV